MWEFFSHAVIALGFAVLVYLGYFLRNRIIAEQCGITTQIPLLTPRQSMLFIAGFTLWTLALILNALRNVDFHIYSTSLSHVHFVLETLVPTLFVATTMFLGHALMYFVVTPDTDENAMQNLQRIKWHHLLSLVVLTGLVTYLLASGPNSPFRDPLLKFLYPLWQFTIIAHTMWFMIYSRHPLRNWVIAFLPLWIMTVVTAINPNPYLNTLSLTLLLTIILRTNFLYVRDSYRRAASFKTQKDVMITYLARLGEEEKTTESEAEVENVSFLGGFNLDRLLSFTLQYGMGLCDALAGAIYVRTDLESLFSRTRDRRPSQHWLAVHDVRGPYPPLMEMGFQSNLERRLEYLHDVVRAEKIPIGKGIVGSVAKTGEPILIPDALHDLRISQQHEDLLRIRSLLAIPLKVQNQTIAVLSFVNRKNPTESYTANDEATLTALSEQAAITIGSAILHNDLQEKERLERELEFAREVQRLLLPTHSPVLERFDIAAMSHPAQDVGGDYYDFLWLDDQHLAVVIADVSGKGFAAALTMASVRSALRAHSHTEPNARNLLVELNRFVRPDMKPGMFVTLLILVLDTQSGRVEVVRAGHDPLLYLHGKSGHIDRVCPAGIALGVINGDLFQQYISREEIQLDEGDTLVLYTDGVTEAMNPSLEEFTLERLLKILQTLGNAKAGKVVDIISKRIEAFAQGAPQSDDQTLIVVKLLDNSSSHSAP